jgi:hypothetical protein
MKNHLAALENDVWMSPDLLITSEDGEKIKTKESTLG